MDIENVLDLSSFLLVEDSADSEADHVLLEPDRGTTGITLNADEDDAESFICGNSSEVLECDDQGLSYFQNYESGEDKQSDVDLRSCNAALMEFILADNGEEEESGFGVSGKMKDNMEDRLFWEICLALGYP